jgi:hypothetical protein
MKYIANVRILFTTSLPRYNFAKKAINTLEHKNRGLSRQSRGLTYTHEGVL